MIQLQESNEPILNVDRALAIKGWMSELELHWLAFQATQHKKIVEIGSYLGRSTRALGDHTPGIVYALDDWIGPRGDNFCGDESFMISDEERQTLYSRFSDNLGDLMQAGKIIPIRSSHEQADKIMFLSPPDMVFIDGDHKYEAVKRDILTWRQKLSRGGLLCGHDASWPGVGCAVRELTGDLLTVPGTDIWFTHDSN